jgi:hypothetical protein
VPITLSTIKDWCRVKHTGDDAALQLIYDGVVREMEERTGWCLDVVTRTQYVEAEPDNEELLLRLERQPVSAVTFTPTGGSATALSLVTIAGLQYVVMDHASLTEYPVTLTLTCGSGTLHPLLQLAVLTRCAQKNAERGDDTVALSSDYWDRISAMMGKGVA